MRLSTKTRYGVRAVFDIAFHGTGNSAQAKDIAKRQQIPVRYLEQIFQDLRKAGLVESKRGPRGGYTLRREPGQIRLGDVVRALQGPIDELFAVERDAHGAGCAGTHAITVDLWRGLAEHMTAWFDGVSIHDLVLRAEAQGATRVDATSRPMYFI